MGFIWGWTDGITAAIAFLFGGLWLSPDLDTRSNALHRWGRLGFIWWPYRRLIRHRSIWSHGPLIGTTVRLVNLLGWLILVILLVPSLNLTVVTESAQQWMNNHPRQIITIALALESSTWLHLVLDGDPWPVEWSHRRNRSSNKLCTRDKRVQRHSISSSRSTNS